MPLLNWIGGGKIDLILFPYYEINAERLIIHSRFLTFYTRFGKLTI